MALRGAGSPGWLLARNNIVVTNGIGLQSTGANALYGDFNLLHGNGAAYGGVAAGAHDRTGDPRFVDAAQHDYRLLADSSAVDSASLEVFAPPGGGERADRGAFEALAAPISLFFGKEGSSCAIGATGVARVEVGLVGPIAHGLPPTQTTPLAWNNAALVTPLSAASYWTATVSAPGDGLYRIYTRASDGLNNIETAASDWYAGSLRADATAPALGWVTPETDVTGSAAAITLIAEVAGFTGDDTAREVAFEITRNGETQVLAGAWLTPTFSSGQPRRFRAMAPLALGSHSIVAIGRDTAGNIGRSPVRIVTISLPQAGAVGQTLAFVNSVQTSKVSSVARLPGSQTSGHGGNAIFVAPLSDQWVNTTTVAVEGVARFGATGGTPQIVLSVDGGAPLTLTLAEFAALPAGGVMPWNAQLAVPGNGAHTLTAQAFYNGVAGQTSAVVINTDTLSPTLSVAAGSGYVTRTATLNGAVGDVHSGVAGVDVSFDGGYLWLPATIASNTWRLTHTLPESREAASYPIRIRARDLAGNVTLTPFVVTVDNVEPRGLDPVAFNIAPGSHLDSIQTLVMTWTAPFDNSGIAGTFATIDQNSATPVLSPISGNALNKTLNLDGAWYAHLGAVDLAGNRLETHYGPWYVSTGLLCAAPRTIQRDGMLDLDNNEWRPGEFLDDDERPMLRGGARQALYATWDADALYLGWRGGAWAVTGAQWTYLDSAPGGTNAPVDAIVPLTVLPFDADIALAVSGPADGRVYRYVNGAWQDQGALSLAFSHTGIDTELRLPLAMGNVGAGLKLVAYAVTDDGAVWSAFPTGNPLAPANGAWADAYAWTNPCATTQPSAGQPRADLVDLQLVAHESADTPLGPNSVIHYTVTLRNHESRAITPGVIALATTHGAVLSHSALTVGALGAGATFTASFEATLASDLAGLREVTSTAQLAGVMPAAQTHRVDGDKPTVALETAPGGVVGPISQRLGGTATDSGSGVASVEISVDGGAWQPVEGTLNWSASVTPTTSQLAARVRARDGVGLLSDAVETLIAIDNQPPSTTLTLPGVLSGTTALIHGSATDAPTGATVGEVALQFGPDSVWEPASNLLAPSNGAQDWNYAWPLPSLDGETRSVRVRAIDAAGNLHIGDWQTTTIDTRAPVITTTVATSQTQQPIAGELFAGSVSDGSGVALMRVIVYVPDGTTFSEMLTPSAGAWRWQPPTLPMRGVYAIRIEATDRAGNAAVAGPFCA